MSSAADHERFAAENLQISANLEAAGHLPAAAGYLAAAARHALQADVCRKVDELTPMVRQELIGKAQANHETTRHMYRRAGAIYGRVKAAGAGDGPHGEVARRAYKLLFEAPGGGVVGPEGNPIGSPAPEGGAA